MSLTATNADGSDTLVRTSYVVVDPPAGGAIYHLTFTGGVSIPGVGNVNDEDVVRYDPSTGLWQQYFDASDVGVTNDVNAVHVRADGNLVLSFNVETTVPGLLGGPNGEVVDDSDLVLFTFTSSGASTAGTFTFLFDGSDVGLTSNGEDIDGVFELPGGGIAISTTGSPGVSGVSGARDEDVLIFTPSQLGSSTAGTWALHFDGSDVGFGSSSEDVCAVAFDGADLLFSTTGSFSVNGASGADEDVGRFVGSFGTSTSGSSSIELDLTALGIDSSEDVDGVGYTP